MIPEAASSILASHPKRRWQSGNAAVRKTVAPGHRWFDSIPAHFMSSWRSWIARHRPKVKVARSSRAGDTMARISLAREAGRSPAVAGFDSRARLHGLWSRGKDGSVLRSRRAFESRRADGGAHVIGTTEYSFPVRIWLVLLSKNQSEKLTSGCKSRFQPEP